MTQDQAPAASAADLESLRRKLCAVTETLTPAEQSILNAILLQATGTASEDAEVQGHWSIRLATPGEAVETLFNLLGIGTSPGFVGDQRTRRQIRDHRS